MHFQFSAFTLLKLHVLMHLFISQDLKFNVNKALPGAPSFSLHSLFLCCHFVSGLLCEKTMVIPGESQNESVIGWLSRPLPEFWEVIGGVRSAGGSFSHSQAYWGTAGVNFLSIEWGKGNTDRKQEAERGNCTHCPSTTLSPWKPPKRGERGSRDFSYPSNP